MSPKETQNQICCYFSILHNLNPKIQNVKCQKWESGKLRRSQSVSLKTPIKVTRLPISDTIRTSLSPPRHLPESG